MRKNQLVWFRALALASGGAFAGCAMQDADSGAPTSKQTLVPLPYYVGGRAHCTAGSPGSTTCIRQWPGSYFETALEGDRIYIQIGEGVANYAISVDGRPRVTLRKPAPGLVKVEDLTRGRHDVRDDVISEGQGGATTFHGFFAPEGSSSAAPSSRTRQKELIGGSRTVGYANTSTKRECTDQEVWDTTDASQGPGALVAARFGADYQINAISGRGVVRNYDGGRGDTLPTADDYALLDRSIRAHEPEWRPEIVVV